MSIYSKTNGHHCFWLKKNGKSLANFDNESDVDEIIEMSELLEKIKLDLDMRSELDDDGVKVVNLSQSIYIKLCRLPER